MTFLQCIYLLHNTKHTCVHVYMYVHVLPFMYLFIYLSFMYVFHVSVGGATVTRRSTIGSTSGHPPNPAMSYHPPNIGPGRSPQLPTRYHNHDNGNIGHHILNNPQSMCSCTCNTIYYIHAIQLGIQLGIFFLNVHFTIFLYC